jgi:hypothetical protein
MDNQKFILKVDKISFLPRQMVRCLILIFWVKYQVKSFLKKSNQIKKYHQ